MTFFRSSCSSINHNFLHLNWCYSLWSIFIYSNIFYPCYISILQMKKQRSRLESMPCRLLGNGLRQIWHLSGVPQQPLQVSRQGDSFPRAQQSLWASPCSLHCPPCWWLESLGPTLPQDKGTDFFSFLWPHHVACRISFPTRDWTPAKAVKAPKFLSLDYQGIPRIDFF